MPSPSSPRRLTSWKEIAAYLGKAERTAKRWEAERGLPVHRIPGKAGGAIWADPEELTAWLTSRPRDEIAASQDDVADEPAADASTTVAEAQTARRAAHARWWWWWAAPAGVAAVALAVSLGLHGLNSDNSQARASTRDADAAELYREGVHDWNTRTPEGLNRAVDEFTQAIVHDPRFAQAYAGLASCYILLREFSTMPDREAYPRAQAAAEQALALDPRLARAHAALAFVQFYWRWRPDVAEREFRTALKLDPNDALTHHWFANVLKVQGRADEAETEILRAQALDSDSSAILADKALILIDAGKDDEGRAILQRMEQVDPNFGSPHAYLSGLALLDGDDRSYLQELRWFSGARGDHAAAELAQAAEQARRSGGEDGLRRAVLAERLALFNKGQGSAYDVAAAYALLSDKGTSAEWLHTAVARHETAALGFLSDRAFRTWRRDPQFSFAARLALDGAAGPSPAASA